MIELQYTIDYMTRHWSKHAVGGYHYVWVDGSVTVDESILDSTLFDLARDVCEGRAILSRIRYADS